ncbi:MAG: hypothetical protein KAJ49_09810 [Arcobacteraceae bacterium]|nr:hypothetical protein [Arcobacteraceae bacterium]
MTEQEIKNIKKTLFKKIKNGDYEGQEVMFFEGDDCVLESETDLRYSVTQEMWSTLNIVGEIVYFSKDLSKMYVLDIPMIHGKLTSFCNLKAFIYGEICN